ncbi:HTH_Tnp_Tc3_2 domain-containing protein [Trichonephila clavipes]|nr:HTH_Tnp_Tc3_2 domain-containing protein [Trichonephila clavipes]
MVAKVLVYGAENTEFRSSSIGEPGRTKRTEAVVATSIHRKCSQETNTRSRPITSYNTCRDRFTALSNRRKRIISVMQLAAYHSVALGRRISNFTVRRHLHNSGHYAGCQVVCVPVNRRQRRARLSWARQHVS